MMAPTLLASVVLAQNVVVPPVAAEVRPAVATVGRCDRCGARVEAIASTIARLRTARSDLVRYTAVLALRRYDWHCHPEVATALIEALRDDREDAVRAEAAVGLAKLRVDLPEAIAALNQAVATDKVSVRFRAKWSLNVLAGQGPVRSILPGKRPVKSLFANRIGTP